ncbi:hypothetical protein GCM10025868_32140 [Angustibacter aerolatus]|uniref:Uncharacterized protein n=1 Tax=Angustibacter aerolatus TaxID=1162965 RepID=A0ABQ6JLG4_9ACTN|nr:hypothetical protein GCM10025868_32140 [Angustibacter aerolatus]
MLDGSAGALRTKVVTDAEGMAAAAPKGGAQTGGGGTAPSPAPALPLVPVLLLAAIALGVLGVRRLPRPVRVTARR